MKTLEEHNMKLTKAKAFYDEHNVHGDIEVLAGKTVVQVIPGEVVDPNPDHDGASFLRFKFSDGTLYDVESSYSMSAVCVTKVEE